MDIKELKEYERLKDKMEDRAIEVIKDYYDYKSWRFPTDFGLNYIDIGNDCVFIYYYGFCSDNSELVPINYFLTLDRKYLED